MSRHLYLFIYLIEVDHDVALGAHAADHVLQSQGVVDPRRVRHVQVVGFVLVPLLYGCNHAVFICTDHVQVLVREAKLTPVWEYNDTSFNSGTVFLYVVSIPFCPVCMCRLF